MKILVYESDKAELFYDISTEKKRKAAFLCLFKLFDNWGFYYDLPGDEQEAYEKAKAGEAEWLLSIRSDYDMEEWTIEYVINPETKVQKWTL